MHRDQLGPLQPAFLHSFEGGAQNRQRDRARRADPVIGPQRERRAGVQILGEDRNRSAESGGRRGNLVAKRCRMSYR